MFLLIAIVLLISFDLHKMRTKWDNSVNVWSIICFSCKTSVLYNQCFVSHGEVSSLSLKSLTWRDWIERNSLSIFQIRFEWWVEWKIESSLNLLFLYEYFYQLKLLHFRLIIFRWKMKIRLPSFWRTDNPAWHWVGSSSFRFALSWTFLQLVPSWSQIFFGHIV